MPLSITEEDVAKLKLSMPTVISVIEETFRMAGEGTAENPPRSRMLFRNGFMQFGPAALHSRRLAGFKLWANFGRGDGVKKSSGYGHTYLYDMDSGELMAVVQAGIIGKLRTGAQTGVAVKYLAPADAKTVGIFGGGTIAEGQLEAVCAVRPIEKILVYTRTAQNREAFCRRMADKLNVDVQPVAEPQAALRDVDIVITATTASSPILFGDWLKGHKLVVAAGANHWYKREIDGAVIERAAMVVTDDLDQSKMESGNLIWAVDHGIIGWKKIRELGEFVAGRAALPRIDGGYILFGSHGIAATQVTIAAKAYELAKAAGLGRQIEF